jgi:hypothetical protein
VAMFRVIGSAANLGGCRHDFRLDPNPRRL